MKKTETMNILIETNKMLREEKDRLEQELQQIQAKVSTEAHVNFSGIQTGELGLDIPLLVTITTCFRL